MPSNAEVWTLVPHLYSAECVEVKGSPCKMYPNCKHARWRVECPECRSWAVSNSKYGPYSCAHCSTEIMVSIQCWVDDLSGENEDVKAK
jgi:hypothetical protein